MLVAVDAPAGLAWGSSLPGSLLPLEWATPRAITAARSLHVEWGETFRGSAAPFEWGAADRGMAARLPLETSVHTRAAEFAAPAEIAGRQTTTGNAASPTEWGGQTRGRAPLPGAAQGGTAIAVEAPAEVSGSIVITAERLLPFAVLAAARTAIAARFPVELSGRTSLALVQQIEALQSRELGMAAWLAELLAAGRGDAGALADSLAGMRSRTPAGPEFLAAMLLDPPFAGEAAARLGLVAKMGGEMLAALLRDAPVPTDGSARSSRAVAARTLLRIEWRQRKRVRIRRLLASSGRRRVLGPIGPGSGR